MTTRFLSRRQSSIGWELAMHTLSKPLFTRLAQIAVPETAPGEAHFSVQRPNGKPK
jgi:hypothetical protein